MTGRQANACLDQGPATGNQVLSEIKNFSVFDIINFAIGPYSRMESQASPVHM